MFVSFLVIFRFIYGFMRWFCLFNRYKNYLGSRIRRADKARETFDCIKGKIQKEKKLDDTSTKVLLYDENEGSRHTAGFDINSINKEVDEGE